MERSAPAYLIHGCAWVDHRVNRRIVESHVPILKREVDALLTASDESAP